MAFQKLSADARRIRTIVVTLPLVGVTSYVLYKRLVLGEPQRRLPQQGPLLSVKTTMAPSQRQGSSEKTNGSVNPNAEDRSEEKTL